MAQPKDFGYGEEQEMLKDSARRFMEDKQPLLALRESIKGTEDPYFGKNRTGSYDKAAWNEMVGLGWTALAVPEEAGGVGMNLVTAIAVSEEVGRASMPTPLTSTLQSTFALREAGTDSAMSWLSKIAEGTSMTLAIYGKEGSLDADSTDITVNDGKLNGTSWYVQDPQKIDSLLVSAMDGKTVKLYCVDLKAEGVDLEFDRIVDLTRDQGHVNFNNVAAECVSEDGASTLKKAMPALLTLLSADMSGGC